MARTSNDMDAMSYRELAQMETRIDRLKIEKQNAERDELRQRILAMVKEAGFEISDVFGEGPQRQRNSAVGQVSRPAEPREYLDWSRTDAPLDGGGDQGREGQEGRFLGLSGRGQLIYHE